MTKRGRGISQSYVNESLYNLGKGTRQHCFIADEISLIHIKTWMYMSELCLAEST